MALFGITAKQWRDTNHKAKGNIRDCASLEQLIVLANLENINALYIKEGLPQAERLYKLNETARYQLASITQNKLKSVEVLKSLK